MRRIAALVAFLALACLACLASAPGAGAANLTVTTTADSSDRTCSPTLCSLRDAFTYTSDGDVVTVPAGRYVLGSALSLFHALTIRGAGAGQTIIDGNAKGRVIDIENNGVLDLSGVTVTGGKTNANSTAGGNGGGIYVSLGDGVPGTLTLRDSVVSGNVGTSAGGGIATQGSTIIINSTISGNSVTGTTAAGTGGGIAASQPGSLQVRASTISGNTAGGAGAGLTANSTTVTLQSVTIADNESSGAGLAGGIFFSTLAAVTATNTIIAGNTPVNCSSLGRGASLTSGYDLSDDGTCNLTASGDQQSVNPLLGALADNGGPTPTHLPAAGSPAIDRGSPSGCLTNDQRGTLRPQNGSCDIGAVEVVPPPPPPPPPPPSPPTTTTPPTTDRPSGQITVTSTFVTPGPVTGSAAATLPPPVAGESSNLHLAQGTVLIQLPGSKAFVKLAADQQVPVGTIIDARKGRVSLSISDGHGGISTAVFYGGIFRFTQTKGAAPLATMVLVGAKPTCATTGQAKRSGHAAKAKKKVASRQLWGDGKGNFQTKGQYSSATVRGTKWNVKDTCSGTTTTVARGIVAVRDFVKQKTVLVKAGHSYLARRRK